MVKQCSRCLYTDDHPLGLTFNEEGLCSGCIVHEEKYTLDWEYRWQLLEDIIKPFRSSNSNYDCIVPVSGANDSYYIIHQVINHLKLKPLVVSYNTGFNTTVGIANLANLRTRFNLDFHQKTIDPTVTKRVTRSALNKLGSAYWPCIAGQTVFPVQTAVRMKIPLIIWGAHQGLEQVGQFSHENEVEMSRRYRVDHDLLGLDIDKFSTPYDDLTETDLFNFRYPSFSDIESVGVRGIYLGNYLKWDNYKQHREMVNLYKYKGYRMSRSFDCYDHADSHVYLGVHDVLKYFKHGYGKVTDQVCREIRHGRLSRDQGQKIVNFYECQQPDAIKLFCDWLGVDQSALLFVLNQHRNPKFWEEINPNSWRPRRLRVGFESSTPLSYMNTSMATKDGDLDHKYITIGRGVEYPPSPEKKDPVSDWL